ASARPARPGLGWAPPTPASAGPRPPPAPAGARPPASAGPSSVAFEGVSRAQNHSNSTLEEGQRPRAQTGPGEGQRPRAQTGPRRRPAPSRPDRAQARGDAEKAQTRNGQSSRGPDAGVRGRAAQRAPSHASAGPAVLSSRIAPRIPTAQEKALVVCLTAQSWARSRARSARVPRAARTAHSSAAGTIITAQ